MLRIVWNNYKNFAKWDVIDRILNIGLHEQTNRGLNSVCDPSSELSSGVSCLQNDGYK